MIIQFSVGNFLSFKDLCTISLEPAAIKDSNESLYISPLTNEVKLLKSLSIHGSNASGKSNLLKAFSFMKRWVLNSFNEANRILEIPVTPYLLQKGYEEKNSLFEIVFYKDQIRYRYGFELNKSSVNNEWLFYSELKKREQHFFIRTGQDITYNNAWKKNSKIKLDPIITYVKPTVLVATVLSQFNVDIGSMIIEWFNKNLIGFDFSNNYFINKTADLIESNPEYYIALHQLIKNAKLGFTSVKPTIIGKYKSEKFSSDFLDFAFNAEVSNDYQILTKHNVYDNKNKKVKEIYFDLKKQESAGSQKFFALAGALLNAIKNSQILWVDEFDSKFHPLLFEAIISFFNSNKFNHQGAQLIFTTHNTQLLKTKMLRRDQIVTVNKSEQGESTIKGVHTSNVRIDASHEREYFAGKFGGIQKLDLNTIQLNLF
jgi:AAA15 family ATPase/GTPase